MGSARVWKQAAMLLLLFAAVDLTVPGLCVADSEEIRVTRSLSHSTAVEDVELDGQHEDCYCCCPHVIPEPRQSLGSTQSMVDDVAQVSPGRTRLTSALLYHPPRAA